MGYDFCYGCGKKNPIGLQLENRYLGKKSHIEFFVRAEHCGYPGVLHGGLTALLFDEALFYAGILHSEDIVTGSMKIQYLKPVLEGTTVCCEGTIDQINGKKIDVSATLKEKNTGILFATAKGVLIQTNIGKILKK